MKKASFNLNIYLMKKFLHFQVVENFEGGIAREKS